MSEPTGNSPSAIRSLLVQHPLPEVAGLVPLAILDGDTPMVVELADALESPPSNLFDLVDKRGAVIVRSRGGGGFAPGALRSVLGVGGELIQSAAELGKAGWSDFYHVVDRGMNIDDPNVLFSATTLPIGFHSDGNEPDWVPDYFALYCQRAASQGGESRLVDAAEAYSRLLKVGEFNDLLSRDFFRDEILFGQPEHAAANAVRSRHWPIFSDGLWGTGITFRYTRRRLETGHDRAGAPLTAKESAFLDVMDATFATAGATFALRQGDLMIVDNRRVAHDRLPYRDGQEKRSLLRAWIRRTSLQDANG